MFTLHPFDAGSGSTSTFWLRSGGRVASRDYFLCRAGATVPEGISLLVQIAEQVAEGKTPRIPIFRRVVL